MFSAMDLSLQEFHPIALLVSERVVGCLIAGTILTTCAALTLRLMNRQSARTKFALCFTTLAGIALLPFIGRWQAAGSLNSQSIPVPVLRLPEEWASLICLLWLVGAAILLGRVVIGLYRVHLVRQSCVPVESAAIDARLQRTLQDFQSERRVQLCTSDLVRVPTAIGFWRPIVALPTWCPNDLSAAELHAVVLHELEHLRRYDDWSNLLQRIIGAVFFFHPAIWWLENRLSLEREMACDAAVLNVVPDPKTYARCLVSLAEKSYLRRGMALAQAVVSRVQQLSARVAQILDARRPAASSIWKPVLSIVVVTGFAGSASLELAPRLVAFQSGERLAANTAFASKTTRGNQTADQSVAPAPAAFELRPTPARWMEPTAVQKFGSKVTGDHSRPIHGSAHELSACLMFNPEQVAAPQQAAINSVAPDENREPATVGASLTERLAQPTSIALHPYPSPNQMLVMVVHTEQRDESGMVFWSVRVVELMVFRPQTQDRVIDPQVPAKT